LGESGQRLFCHGFLLSYLLLLADVRPTDVWDQGDVIGAILLVAIIVGTLIVVRVTRRR
jgi:hypothetical protein